MKGELRITERWGILSDAHNWILREYSAGTSRKGEPIVSYQDTYHRDLLHIARWIVDEEAKGALQGFDGSEDLEELMTAVRESQAALGAKLQTLWEGVVK